jgi:hypothetical protein
MKRIGYLFEKIYDKNNLKLAIKNASKYKRKRADVRKILNNEEKYINKLYDLLKNETYILNQNLNKFQVIECGKVRDIIEPRFYPDQIIHWALIQVIKDPVLMRGMYEFNCGSINGRGGNLARKYTERIMRKKKCKYCLKLDIKKYFPNIDCKRLYKKFERKIKDEKTLRLIHTIIGDGIGLPIGYYSSQWFSNFNLQDLDHFIKETLHIKFYSRYVDDMVLCDNNKRKLHQARLEIDRYLKENEGLELKGNYQVFDLTKRPIDYVGYQFQKEHKTLLRKRIFKKIKKRVNKIKKHNNCCVKQAQGLMSLIGWLKKTLSYNFYSKCIKPIIKIGTLKRIISDYAKLTT